MISFNLSFCKFPYNPNIYNSFNSSLFLVLSRPSNIHKHKKRKKMSLGKSFLNFALNLLLNWLIMNREILLDLRHNANIFFILLLKDNYLFIKIWSINRWKPKIKKKINEAWSFFHLENVHFSSIFCSDLSKNNFFEKSFFFFSYFLTAR